jgi:hypothetical protein
MMGFVFRNGGGVAYQGTHNCQSIGDFKIEKQNPKSEQSCPKSNELENLEQNVLPKPAGSQNKHVRK